MVSDAGNIPGKAPGGQQFVFTDLAYFDDIEEAAESVFLRCVQGHDLAGWHSAGKSLRSSDSQRKRETICSIQSNQLIIHRPEAWYNRVFLGHGLRRRWTDTRGAPGHGYARCDQCKLALSHDRLKTEVSTPSLPSGLRSSDFQASALPAQKKCIWYKWLAKLWRLVVQSLL